MENNIIQEFIKLLYNEPNHRRDFESMKISLNYIFKDDNINDEQIVEIKNTLISEKIVKIEILNGVLYLILNNIGFEIIQIHSTYSNYITYLKQKNIKELKDKKTLKQIAIWTFIFTILSLIISVCKG